MFVQVIQGHVANPEGLHRAFDRWMRELAPDSVGWLGTTAGVTPSGDCVAVARFESADAAARNSQRPEQDRWWGDTSQLFDGEVTFYDCPDAVTFMSGGSDDAGFVQVMQGEVRDPARARELMGQMERVGDFRPEIIGGVDAVHRDGGHFTDVIYFTSEAEARAGERREPPAELRDAMGEQQRVYGEISFYDLPEPWLYSPQRMSG